MIEIKFVSKALNTECKVTANDEYSAFAVVSMLLKSRYMVYEPTMGGVPVFYKWSKSFKDTGAYA